MSSRLDRHLYLLPVIVFVAGCIAGALSERIFGAPMSFTNSGARLQFYSSLAGSSSSLLGFLIAAITILTTFGRRTVETPLDRRRETALAAARSRIVGVLLISALFMLQVLITASIGIASSNSTERLKLTDSLAVAGSVAGLVGILIGGLGLALAVAERAKD